MEVGVFFQFSGAYLMLALCVVRGNMEVSVQISKEFEEAEIINLYKANGWLSAKPSEKLIPALLNSNTLITVRKDGQLIGIGNTISETLSQNLCNCLSLT